MTKHHTIVTTVENKPGVLARVAGLFARRGFNIESLAVAPTDDEAFSRITFVVDVESAPLEQVVKQLDKLINVVEIVELDPTESVALELLMIKIEAQDPSGLAELIESFEATILEERGNHFLVTMTDDSVRLDDFEERLRPFGIAEVQRTGKVALRSLDAPER
ncbi:MAG: acetolactate synthase small subunit [Acidobacteria bacterium]|nr:acetolactate synthase small subunit [Acidobacteriota bacterium]